MNPVPGPPRYTKMFAETRWHQRPLGGGPGSWTELREEGKERDPIEDQVRRWIDQTGAIIVLPAQTAIHKQWMDADLTMLCVTIAQTITYVEAQHATGERSGQEAATDRPAANQPYPAVGAGVQSTGDGPNRGVPAATADGGTAIKFPSGVTIRPRTTNDAAPPRPEPIPGNTVDPGSGQLTGGKCSVCGEPRFATASGDVCINGHGGA